MVHENSPAISVVIIEDHQMLSDALVTLVNSTPDLVAVGSADTCASGLALVERTRPDVLVMDVGLPDGDGIDLVAEVRRCHPQACVLIMTSLSDTETLKRAIDAGVNGFVPKRRPAVELLSAIRQAAAGEIVMPAGLLLTLLSGAPKETSPASRPARLALTAREREVLACLAVGQSSPQISTALSIAPPTVRTHIGNLMTKLGVHSRLEAVAVALRDGLIERPF
jgi:DNA-binding NarL/FixJ family response regulator